MKLIELKQDVEEKIKKSTAKRIYIYDKEFDSYDYITDIYEDKQGDLIIEVGGDA